MASTAAAAPESPHPQSLAPLLPRVLSLIYEGLLLVAVLWLAGFLFGAVEKGLGIGHSRPLFQGFLLTIAGLYFVWQWTRGGQTLPMKTWRLRVVSADGTPLTMRRAALRYVAALLSLGLFGAGFAWPIFDREGQFLHDRIARTRIVRTG